MHTREGHSLAYIMRNERSAAANRFVSNRVLHMFRVIFTVFVTIVVAYLFLASMSGCGHRRTPSEATTEVESTDSDRARYGAKTNAPKVVERSEPTTVARDHPSGGGTLLNRW